ncbi:MAG: C25 family cysteine peptidase [Candidatus Thermoplasmatota archaeon]
MTHPDFQAAAELLRAWKIRKGIDTEVVNTTVTGSTNSSIRAYIENAYNTWTPAPSYILFLGDAEFIPTNYFYEHPDHDCLTGSDLWYMTVNGTDYYPDLYYGRIPVDNEPDAYAVITKIINYEQNPPTFTYFYNNITVAAYFQDKNDDGYEDRRFVRTSEEIRDYLLSIGYDVERIYTAWSNRTPTNYNDGYYGVPTSGDPIPAELLRSNGFAWDGDANDIINRVQSGSLILNYRDHGARDGWSDPAFSCYNIPSLGNGDLQPLVFSMACMNGWFDHETDDMDNINWPYESFCEDFLIDDEGAIGLFGATRVSASGYNDYMMRGFYDAIWPNFDTTQGNSTPMYRMGEVLNYGKTYMANTWGDGWGWERRQFEMFHYFGDPTMELWTSAPVERNVSHSSTITVGTTSVDVNVDIDGALVTIVMGGDLQGLAYSSGGVATVTISPAEGGRSMTVTVTEHGSRSYTGKIIVPGGAHDIEVDDFSVPITGSVGAPVDVKANVLNVGTSPESNIEVQLKINGTVENSTMISLLGVGEYMPVSFSWAPLAPGEYTVGMYAVPVPLETVVINNEKNGTFRVEMEPEEDINDNAFEFALEPGQTDSANLTIENNGRRDLDFTIIPGWKSAQNLVYFDYAPFYSIDALRNLGLRYLNTTNLSGPTDFFGLLTGGTDWDLVIFNSYAPPDTPTWVIDALNDYLIGGGKLIYNDHSVNGSNPLTNTMRFSYASNYTIPLDLYIWNTTHQIFNRPNSVPNLTWSHNQLLIDGQKGDGILPTKAIAGYTISPTINEGAIVVNGTSSIFNAFQPVNFQNDSDLDTKADMVELYENEIYYLLNGSSHWLSFSPINGSIDPSGRRNITITVNATTLSPGFYQERLIISSNDPDEDVIIVWVNLTVGERKYAQIPVQLGWNLISTPLIPDDTRVPDVFIDLDGDTTWDRMLWYDATAPGGSKWKQYCTYWATELNDLRNVDHRMAVWIYIPNATALGDGYINVSGITPATTMINLYAGWNLVGYPAKNDSLYTVGDLKAATGAPYTEGFNASALYQTSVLPDTYVLRKCEGYWVYVPSDSSWVIDW